MATIKSLKLFKGKSVINPINSLCVKQENEMACAWQALNVHPHVQLIGFHKNYCVSESSATSQQGWVKKIKLFFQTFVLTYQVPQHQSFINEDGQSVNFTQNTLERKVVQVHQTDEPVGAKECPWDPYRYQIILISQPWWQQQSVSQRQAWIEQKRPWHVWALVYPSSQETFKKSLAQNMLAIDASIGYCESVKSMWVDINGKQRIFSDKYLFTEAHQVAYVPYRFFEPMSQWLNYWCALRPMIHKKQWVICQGDVNKEYQRDLLAKGWGILPYKGHPGAFGVKRKNHMHEGVDIYMSNHQPISSLIEGFFEKAYQFTGPELNQPWWNPTSAVLHQTPLGYINYGELEPVWPRKGLPQIGEYIETNQTVGYCQRVLKVDKGRPMDMIHVELYATDQVIDQWALGVERPEQLLDPTSLLCWSMRTADVYYLNSDLLDQS